MGRASVLVWLILKPDKAPKEDSISCKMGREVSGRVMVVTVFFIYLFFIIDHWGSVPLCLIFVFNHVLDLSATPSLSICFAFI